MKKKDLYRLGTVEEEVVSYNSGMIIREMENAFLIIFDSLKEMIIYYKEWMIFDIVEIRCYNMIFEIL